MLYRPIGSFNATLLKGIVESGCYKCYQTLFYKQWFSARPTDPEKTLLINVVHYITPNYSHLGQVFSRILSRKIKMQKSYTALTVD